MIPTLSDYRELSCAVENIKAEAPVPLESNLTTDVQRLVKFAEKKPNMLILHFPNNHCNHKKQLLEC